MFSIIVAFPKMEDANKIKSLLIRSGFKVQGVCTNGAMAIQMAEQIERGILICGCKFADMTCRDVKAALPFDVSMLVLASKRVWDLYGGDNIIFQEMPLKVHELVNTLEMMIRVSEKYRKKPKNSKPKPRNDEEKELILKSKNHAYGKNNLSEEEAYRYIQKNSMDSGNLIWSILRNAS